MTRWEYLKVETDYDNHLDRVHRVNDAELADWKKGPAVSAYVNQLGAEGWEIVSGTSFAVAMAVVPSRVLWFKRPLG